jgi:hypothetical protein
MERIWTKSSCGVNEGIKSTLKDKVKIFFHTCVLWSRKKLHEHSFLIYERAPVFFDFASQNQKNRRSFRHFYSSGWSGAIFFT